MQFFILIIQTIVHIESIPIPHIEIAVRIAPVAPVESGVC
jgi:hypothetical protein